MIELENLKKIKRVSNIETLETRLRRVLSITKGAYSLELYSKEGLYLFDYDVGTNLPKLKGGINVLENSDKAKEEISKILREEELIKDFSIKTQINREILKIIIIYTIKGEDKENSLTLDL